LRVGTDSREEPDSLWDTAFQFNPANLVAALIIALLLAGLTAAIFLTRPATYESTATLAVDQPSLIASGGSGVLDKLSRVRAKYAPLLTTDVMTQPLAKELGTTPQAVRSSLSATTPGVNLLILVKASRSNRAQAQAFASAAATALAKYATDDQTRAGVPAKEQFSFTVVDQARPGTKTAPDRSQAIAIAVVVGLVATALIYVALQLLRPKARSSLDE